MELSLRGIMLFPLQTVSLVAKTVMFESGPQRIILGPAKTGMKMFAPAFGVSKLSGHATDFPGEIFHALERQLRHRPVAAAIRHNEESMTPAPDDPPTRPNALLDDYEPGATSGLVASVFDPLREELVQLVGEIRDCGRSPDSSILKREVSK